jgi:hypothetical protein
MGPKKVEISSTVKRKVEKKSIYSTKGDSALCDRGVANWGILLAVQVYGRLGACPGAADGVAGRSGLCPVLVRVEVDKQSGPQIKGHVRQVAPVDEVEAEAIKLRDAFAGCNVEPCLTFFDLGQGASVQPYRIGEFCLAELQGFPKACHPGADTFGAAFPRDKIL